VISDRYEVGSVFKVITLAAALELGVVNLNQPINCENGTWIYKQSALHDDGHRNGILPVRGCLAKSSNIGLAKIALLVGTNRLYDFITKFGFTRATGVPLPYETPGFIRNSTNWTPTSITRVAIGQELAVSQLQLAMAYAAIANDGKLMRPMLVRQLDHADGTLWGRYQPTHVGTVVRAETARQVRAAMVDVVEYGTGKAAALSDYTVAGKTGTAQKSDGHRYVPGRLYCSFVGMVPAGKPELVIAVAVDEPKDSAYGGIVAAPVFREIAEQAVVLYGIAPDKKIGSSRLTFRSNHPDLPRDMLAMMP
jgi:cell division protein FtsI (penicillin-binding protein 3)